MTEQIIEHNGKRYRVVEELGPVRGPLGGELKTWEQLQPGEKGFLHVRKGMFNQNLDEQAFERFKETVEKAPKKAEGKGMEIVKQKLINRINSLSDLKDGWNDCKSTAIPARAIQNALNVLNWIEDSFLPNISICPLCDGRGINFETNDCPFQLQFDVYTDRVEQTLWTDDNDGLIITIPIGEQNDPTSL